MLEICDFSKSYKGLKVYENFNLSFEDGKITCILGESGSGKTTLLNAVAGLIDFDGKITKKKCSYVFQTPRLVPNLTVYGNLKLICSDGNKISDMLESVSLSDKADSYPVKLSGGQAQRVALARAFLYDSEVVLMDEPFSSLDLKLKNQMMQLFLSVWQQDKRCAVFVTHDIDEAVFLAQRIVIISGGKIKSDIALSSGLPRSAEERERLRSEVISELL